MCLLMNVECLNTFKLHFCMILLISNLALNACVYYQSVSYICINNNRQASELFPSIFLDKFCMHFLTLPSHPL
jgi:hypothetical protein